jgi:hypothetical protein
MLTQFLLGHYSTHANLGEESWFQHIMRCWGRSDPEVDIDSLSQQDAAEFIHVWLELLATPAFDMSWERRLLENDRPRTVDSSGPYMPICLKFDDHLAHMQSCDLTFVQHLATGRWNASCPDHSTDLLVHPIGQMYSDSKWRHLQK